MGAIPFWETFSVLLTDNGSEFKQVEKIERSIFGGKRCHLFFSHPYSSWEKPHVEQAHRLIRYCLPKGTSFAFLKLIPIARLHAHIHSYPTLVKGKKAPLDRVALLPPQSALDFFALQRISKGKVNLAPSLLK